MTSKVETLTAPYVTAPLIPAQAGIQLSVVLDSRFHGNKRRVALILPH
jgi:hypothetical protein